MKVKACFLLVILIVATFGLQVGVKSVEADGTFEPIFESGMDLLFIRDLTTPYGQMLLDTSVWENHGYMQPKTTPYTSAELTFGKYGYGLEFDGSDDCVSIPDDSSLDLATCTIMFWIKPSETYQDGRPNQWYYFLNRMDPTSTFEIGYQGWNDLVEFKVYNSTGGSYNVQYNMDLTSGTWYHFAFSVNSTGGMNIYVNGELEASENAIVSEFAQTASKVYISHPTYGIHATIDELRIFPYALTQDHIYNQIITPIAEFNQESFVESYNNVTGWSEGTINGYTGFYSNDPDLLYAKSDSTYGETILDSIKYLPSFQNYRYYCSLGYDDYTDLDTYGTTSQSAQWLFYFYKNGEETSSYRIKIEPFATASPAWVYVKVTFTHYYGGIGYTKLLGNLTAWTITDWQSNWCQKIPLIVDAWVGSDDKHFTMRVTLENRSAVFVNTDYYYTYSYDLRDSDGNIRSIDWFDGWVTQTTRVTNSRYWEIYDESEFGIVEHGLIVIIAAVLVALYVIGSLTSGAGYAYITRPIISAVSGYALPENPLEAIAGEGNPLIHGIIAAFQAVMKPIADALKPIWQAIQSIGKMVVQAMLDFSEQAIKFLDSIAAALGYPNLFSNLFSWLANLWTWMIDSFTYLISALTSAFTLILSFISKLLNTLSTMVTQWVAIIQGIFGMLGDSMNTGVHLWNDLNLQTWVVLIAIMYPVYLMVLWDRKGIDAAIGHVKMLLDIGAFIAHIFITVIQLFLNVIGRIIESIPVVE